MALDVPLTTMRVLCLDSGSSSLKYAIYDMPGEQLVASAVVEVAGASNQSVAVASIVDQVQRQDKVLDAVGHRVVFGGPDHVSPQRVDDALLASLERLAPFDPVHMPSALAVIRRVAQAAPSLPAVACFDSAFHRVMPAIAKRYPLPKDAGPMVQRYGYHGLSYEYVVSTLQPRGRALIAHLGNGASMAATLDGKPIDTSMGFSPIGGMMMGTRPGDLDPGVLLYLLAAGGQTPASLAELLQARSGLLGVSGATADMRALLERAPQDAAAREAVDLFVYSAVKQAGAMVAALGGLDLLVFTGGIGEHAWQIRAAICAGCAHLGIVLDQSLNRAGAPTISAPESRVSVRVIATNENLVIARHVVATLATASQPARDSEQ